MTALLAQAKLLGLQAAYSMAGQPDQGEATLNLELFTHVTRFLGHRIVLLGLYNGQRLQEEPDSDIVTYTRSTEVCAPSWAAVQGHRHLYWVTSRLGTVPSVLVPLAWSAGLFRGQGQLAKLCASIALACPAAWRICCG